MCLYVVLSANSAWIEFRCIWKCYVWMMLRKRWYGNIRDQDNSALNSAISRGRLSLMCRNTNKIRQCLLTVVPSLQRHIVVAFVFASASSVYLFDITAVMECQTSNNGGCDRPFPMISRNQLIYISTLSTQVDIQISINKFSAQMWCDWLHMRIEAIFCIMCGFHILISHNRSFHVMRFLCLSQS